MTTPSPQRVELPDIQDLPGTRLRQRREERGLTIDDLWRATKINRAALRAIEATDVVHLPAPIYTRGFVKAYAREVGLDPDLTAADYLRRLERLRTPAPLPASDAAHMPKPQNTVRDHKARNLLAANHGMRFSRLSFAIAAAGLAVYIASFYYRADAPDSAQYVDSAETDRTPDGDATPAIAEDAGPDATAAAFAGAPLRLEFVSRDECWLAARVDGERVFARLLQPGDRQTFDVDEEVVLRVGEPGALALSINGEPARPLGRAGQPITIRITRDNFRDFLSS